MTEVEIAFECYGCDTAFDDMDDGITCSVCGNHICEGCQEEHATDHCFKNLDAVSDEKRKKK